MNEKIFEALAADLKPAIAEAQILDALVGVWLSAIYGSTTLSTP